MGETVVRNFTRVLIVAMGLVVISTLAFFAEKANPKVVLAHFTGNQRSQAKVQ